MNLIIGIVNIIFQILTIVVVIDVVVSYFLSPYNNVRMFLDRIVNPMLAPIRRIIPPVQMIDFSPIILLVLLQVVQYLILLLLRSIG